MCIIQQLGKMMKGSDRNSGIKLHSVEKETQPFLIVSGTDQMGLENTKIYIVSREIVPAYIHVKIFFQHAGNIEPWVKIVTRGQT